MAAHRASSSANTGATAASSLVVSIPSGMQYHDVMLAAIAHDGGTTSTISTPSGWTLLRNTVSATAGLRITLYWRLVDGTESANYTWNFDTARQASGVITAHSGTAITPPPSNSSGSTTTASTSLAGVGTNSTQETGLGLQFYAARNTTGSITQTPNIAYTKRVDTCTTASVFIGLAAQDTTKGLPIGGTTTTGTTVSTSSTGVGVAVFLEDARPAFLPLNVDEFTVGSASTSSSSIPGSAIVTTTPNQTILAIITINKDAVTVSSLVTTGLTWTLVSRANTNTGSVEIWRTFIATPTTTGTTTITFSAAAVSVNYMFAGFMNADFSGSNGSAAIGAVTSGTFSAAAPSASVTTTRNNSMVWAFAQSSTTATAPTAGSGQTIIRSQTDATNTAQSIMWRQTSRTPQSGTTVTMNLTAPAAGTGNITAIEILPAQIYSLGALGVG